MNRTALLSVLALVAVTIGSVVYIVGGVLGVNPLRSTTTLTMTIPSRSQLQVGSPVNLHGIRIGSVKSVTRAGTAANLVLTVDDKYSIPTDSDVKIEQLSAVGEPYINFVPAALRAPYLPDGATVAAEKVSTPPEAVDVFKRISTLTNEIESNDVAGLLESLRLATNASPEALSRITQAGSLFEQVIVSRLPEIRTMLAASQVYQSNLGWLPAAVDSAGSATADLLPKVDEYLRVIDAVVARAGTPGINRDAITPFVQQIGPDTTRVLVTLGPLAGPLIPLVREATQATAQIDMAQVLAGAVRSFDSDGNLRVRVVPGK